jgi:hypothetical protein
MITSINGYELDTKVSMYGDELIPFGADSYALALMDNRQRIFKKEEYYHAAKNVFLGRETPEAMVAAIKGKIYKISYRFSDIGNSESKRAEYSSFRNKLTDFVISSLGKDPVPQIIDDNHKLLWWETQQGNVIIDLDAESTEIILTSSSARKARKLGYFKRLMRGA